LQIAADPIAPSVARHQVRRWLAASAWPADQLPDIVLALSEAVTNAAEHAYRDRPPGMIELHGGIELAPGGRRRVTLTVRDHGRWRRPPTNDPDRRRGIPLMRACMDTVAITEPDDRKGTQVIFRSRAIPTPG
jgi:anti-sigma regulatory factor (Ser/Thr protein kinase)